MRTGERDLARSGAALEATSPGCGDGASGIEQALPASGTVGLGVFQARRQRHSPRELRFSGAVGRMLWGTLGLRPSLHAAAPKWGVRLPVSLAALPGPRAGGLRAGLPRRAVGPDQPGWITAQATRGPELPAGCEV